MYQFNTKIPQFLAKLGLRDDPATRNPVSGAQDLRAMIERSLSRSHPITGPRKSPSTMMLQLTSELDAVDWANLAGVFERAPLGNRDPNVLELQFRNSQ